MIPQVAKGEWALIELPEGRQPLPDWLRGMHIDWKDRFSSLPDFTLKCTREPGDWEGKVWEKVGSKRYQTISPNGVAQFHYHDGAVCVEDVPVDVQGEDGKWRVEMRQMRATTKQKGYGGRIFVIRMKDGEDLALRGPWHGGAPVGYTACSTFVTTASWRNRPPAKGHGSKTRRWWRPWWEQTACFGNVFTDELVVRMFARYHPTLRLAATNPYGSGVYLEPLKPEWDAPKSVLEERKRAAWLAEQAAKKAATHG